MRFPSTRLTAAGLLLLAVCAGGCGTARRDRLRLNAAPDRRVRVYALCDAGATGFIAREAALHLSEMTGVAHPAPLRIQELAQSVPPALVLEEDSSLGREAFSCRVEQGRVRVRGGDARGVYYGLLSFFETLGFRWYAPGDDGAVIPKCDAVEIPADWTAQGAPGLRWRGYHICGTGLDRNGRPMGHFDHETVLWMARNRMNYKLIHNEQYDAVAPLLRETLLAPLAFGHSFSQWIPESEFESHPEWFPLIAGKRQRIGQRCLSNPELQRTVVDRIAAFAESHPDLEIVSLAPNDGYKWCQCPECARMDSPEDATRSELNRRNHLFAARIAAAAARRIPGLRLSSLSYSNYLEPGGDVPREENLVISMCITCAQNHALDDPSSPLNRAYLDRLDRWQAKAGGIFWSAYYLSYGGTYPRPYERQITRTIRLLAEKGVEGIKSEVVPGRHDPWPSAVFFMYLVPRVAYDLRADPDALLEDFCRRYYGPAWEPCLAYHRLNSAAVERLADDMTHMTAAWLPRLYSEDAMREVERLAQEAERRAHGADPVYARRLTPLLRQARELIESRAASAQCEAESAPLRLRRLPQPPRFEDFDTLEWTPLRMRTNRIPFMPPSRFAAVATDDTLWICVQAGEPDVEKSFESTPPGASPWHGSSVDCFISPDPESGVYFQAAVNVRGNVYTARCRGREMDSEYPLQPEVVVRRLDERWELILGVRFDRMQSAAPSEGRRIRLSVNRGQSCGTPLVLGGWPNGGSWHRIDTMGEAILGSAP